jgi:hypothetical protein
MPYFQLLFSRLDVILWSHAFLRLGTDEVLIACSYSIELHQNSLCELEVGLKRVWLLVKIEWSGLAKGIDLRRLKPTENNTT